MRRRDFLAATAATAAVPLLPRVARAAGAAGTLRFVPSVALTSIDPLWSLATISFVHGYMVWDTLFGIDAKLNAHPQAAAGADLSSDRLTWTITLRDGLVFHDKQKVRAADAVASLKRLSQKDPFWQTIAGITNEMTAIDDTRFKIVLKKPFNQMPFALGARNTFIMPERIVSIPATQQFTEVVGSGPYRFLPGEFQAGARAAYEKFDGYVPRQEPPDLWSGGKVVHFDRVEWTAQPDPATAAAALQRGEVDWVEQPLLDLVPLLKRDAKLRVQQVDPFGGLGILRFNQLNPPFDNPKLRQALLPAINQKDIVTSVVGDQTQYGVEPVGFFPTWSPYASDAGMTALTSPRSIDEAKKLIAASGYKGERIVMVAPSDLPAIMAMSQVTQDLLTHLGLKIDFQVMDWGTMISRIASKAPVENGGWSCFCVTWAGLTVSTPGSSYPLRANGQAANTGWPTDPKLEDLRNQWLDAEDLAAQQAICRQIQEEAFVSLPFIPIGQVFGPAALSKDVTDVLRSPFSLFWNVRKA